MTPEPTSSAKKREKVIEVLKNLEPHSPQWVEMIRKYIFTLEKERNEAREALLIAVKALEKMKKDFSPYHAGEEDREFLRVEATEALSRINSLFPSIAAHIEAAHQRERKLEDGLRTAIEALKREAHGGCGGCSSCAQCVYEGLEKLLSSPSL